MTSTCLATGEWDKNASKIVCRNESSKPLESIFIVIHNHIQYPVSCVLPAPPLNGALFNTSQNTNQIEGSVITFQCDPDFSLRGTATATCNNSGLWDPDPALLECKFIMSHDG